MGGCLEAVTGADNLQTGVRREIAVRLESYRGISHLGFPLTHRSALLAAVP